MRLRFCFFWVACVFVGFFVGCAGEFDVDGDAVISCAADGDCPAPLVCSVPDARCVPAGETGPVVVAHSLTAAVSAGGVATLHIEADAAVEGVPVLTWAGDDPGLAFVSQDDTAADKVVIDMAVTVGAAGAPDDGFYVLEAITLTSPSGLARRTPVDAALHVDRRAPDVDVIASFDGGAPFEGAPFADVDGGNALVLLVSASERLAPDAVVAVDSVDTSGACDPDGANGFVCSLVLLGGPAALTSTDLSVSVHDLAGNLGTGTVSLPLDLAPPTVLSSSVTITSGGGAREEAAAPGSQVEVDLVASEVLSEPPALELIADVVLANVVSAPVAGSSLGWRISFDVAEIGDASSVRPRFALVDRVGHRASIEGETALRFALVRRGPCDAVVERACVDHDGDGQFVVDDACAAGTDCDDGDATVFDGAPEVPGDGRANDCSGADVDGDLVEGGVFVDAIDGGDFIDCGTPEEPCERLDTALENFPNARFVVARGEGIFLTGSLDVPVIGGMARDALNDAFWFRDRRLPPTALAVSAAFSGAFVDGVELRVPLVERDRLLAIDSRINVTTMNTTLMCVRCREAVPGQRVQSGLIGSRIIESDFPTLEVFATDVVVVRSTLQQLVNHGTVTVVSSSIAAVGTDVAVSSSGDLRVYGSTIFGSISSTSGLNDFVGNILVASPSSVGGDLVTLTVNSNTPLRLRHNRFVERALSTGLVLIAGSGGGGFAHVDDFVGIVDHFGGDDPIAGNAEADSAGVDGSFVSLNAAVAPSSWPLLPSEPQRVDVDSGVALDFFGDCRVFGAGNPVGADSDVSAD